MAEVVDVKLVGDVDPASILPSLNAACPDGLTFTAGVLLGPEDAAITKFLTGARYLLTVPVDDLANRGGKPWLGDRIRGFLSEAQVAVQRTSGGISKPIDVRSHVRSARLDDGAAADLVRRAGLSANVVVIDVDVGLSGSGGVKVGEIIAAITQITHLPHRGVRADLYCDRHGKRIDPLDTAALRTKRPDLPDCPPAAEL